MPRMKLKDLAHIPLAKAFLCVDCQCIGNQAEACPACASSHCLISMANLLEGRIERAPMSQFRPIHGRVKKSLDTLSRAG